MAVKASSFKNWCTENISPQSWSRIALKCMDELRETGLTLKQMEDPTPDFDLDPKLLSALNSALSELYEMTVDQKALS